MCLDRIGWVWLSHIGDCSGKDGVDILAIFNCKEELWIVKIPSSSWLCPAIGTAVVTRDKLQSGGIVTLFAKEMYVVCYVCIKDEPRFYCFQMVNVTRPIEEFEVFVLPWVQDMTSSWGKKHPAITISYLILSSELKMKTRVMYVHTCGHEGRFDCSRRPVRMCRLDISSGTTSMSHEGRTWMSRR